MKTMISKYNGTCACCGGAIRKGEQIAWSKATGALHAACAGISLERTEQETQWQSNLAELNARGRKSLNDIGRRETVAEFNKRDHSSHEDRQCGDMAYEDMCAARCEM